MPSGSAESWAPNAGDLPALGADTLGMQRQVHLGGAGGSRPAAHLAPIAPRSASASRRRHSEQGRWPAASAVASSRKNSSV